MGGGDHCNVVISQDEQGTLQTERAYVCSGARWIKECTVLWFWGFRDDGA